MPSRPGLPFASGLPPPSCGAVGQQRAGETVSAQALAERPAGDRRRESEAGFP